MSERPDSDQVYLASRISERLSIPALQKLNTTYGRIAVTNALRLMRGFPPKELKAPYPYLVALCKATA